MVSVKPGLRSLSTPLPASVCEAVMEWKPSASVVPLPVRVATVSAATPSATSVSPA